MSQVRNTGKGKYVGEKANENPDVNREIQEIGWQNQEIGRVENPLFTDYTGCHHRGNFKAFAGAKKTKI